MLNYSDELTKGKEKYNQIAIGYFDGIHAGHQEILSRLNEDDLIVTFYNKVGVYDIYPAEEKVMQLKKYCPNVMIFDLEKIKEDSKEKFINYLSQFEPKCVIVGEDFHFGNKKEGDAALLSEYFPVEIISTIKDSKGKISSTRIRKLLREGNIKKAEELLTRPYQIESVVIHGHGRGQELGFPTINFNSKDYRNLRQGVYATRCIIDDKEYKSITNIGSRPTFDDDNEISIETNIFNFNDDIYSKTLSLRFVEFLRDEIHFDSVDELIAQIKEDIKKV